VTPLPLEYVDDIAPAAWIAERLHPFAQDAGSIVPPGFEAYARVFHPAVRRVGDVELPVRWREVADANLRVHHPRMQFGALVARVGTSTVAQHQSGLFDRWPRTGTLRLEDARALTDVLARYTTTPDRCWFAAWEGFGSLSDGSMAIHSLNGATPEPMPPDVYREKPAEHPTFRLPHRGYYIAKGPLEAALETVYGATWAYQSASIWWPDDRAWCVATEIDFDWTYVGGSQECVAAVLGSPDLEALPARLSDGVTYASDPINPTPVR
jgi:hypothetical protein